MAQAKSKAKPKEAKGLSAFRGREVLGRLWRNVPPNVWLSMFQEAAPSNKWTLKGHSMLSGCCPYHDDKTPSFVINFNKGYGKCFGCGKLVIDPISLYAKLRGLSHVEALMEINSRHPIEGMLGGGSVDDLNQYHRVQEAKKAIAVAFNSVLNEVIRENPEHLKYCRPAAIYLTQTRGIDAKVLGSLPVGVYAKPEHLKKYIKDTTLMPIIEDYLHKSNNNTYYGAVMFHYNDSPGTISRFKTRLIDQIKFRALKDPGNPTPEEADLFIKTSPSLEDPYVTSMGVFGLFTYRWLLGGQNIEIDPNVYVTEGEFDMLSIAAIQAQTGVYDFVLLASGGTGTPDLSFLREYGVKTVWLVPDHPSKNGDTYTRAILSNKENFTQSAAIRPLAMKIFTWPADLRGGDLDEATRVNGYSVIRKFLSTDRNSYFLNALPWITDRCDKQLEKIQLEYDAAIQGLDPLDSTYAVQHANLRDERLRNIQTRVVDWLNLLHEHDDKLRFIDTFARKYDVDVSNLSEALSALHNLGSVDGVVNLIAESLAEYFVPAYKQGEGGYYTWAPHKGELVRLNMSNDPALESTLAEHIGTAPVRWADRILGDNSIYLEGVDGQKPGMDARTKRRNLREFLRDAFNAHFIPKMPSIEDLHKFSQGIHFEGLPAEARREGIAYFVNGKKIFKGQFADGGVTWELLEGIVDKNVLFEDLSMMHKWSSVEDVADLEMAGSIDLSKLYEAVLKMVDAWKFRDHDIVRHYLAGYILALPTMRAVGDCNITVLTGASASGKTTLAQGLLGSNTLGANVPCLLESSVFNFDTTPSVMYRSMHGKSLMFIVDEAEESEKHNTKHDENTKELARKLYMIPKGSEFKRTDRSGGISRWFLKMPVLLAAINVPSDPVFLSRTMMIYTEKEVGRTAPEAYIYSMYTKEEVDTFRKNITLALIPRMPEVIHAREELKKVIVEKLKTYGNQYSWVSTRFLDNVIGSLTVVHMVGEQAGVKAEDLYIDILHRYKDRLITIHGENTQNEVLDDCLYEHTIKIMKEDNVTEEVSAQHLIIQGEYNRLNNEDCGVYYYEPMDCIVIVWRQAKYSVLRKSRYHSFAPSTLTERANKCPLVIRDLSQEQVEDIISHLGLSGIKAAHEITVFPKEYLAIGRGTPSAEGSAPPKEVAEKIEASEVSTVDAGGGLEVMM